MPGYTLAALSVSASAGPHGSRRGGGTSVSWLPPAGTFCICLQHSSIALAAAATAAAVAAALVVAVVASCPRGGARLAPTVLIFIHSVNMQIARPEPGLACLPWWQQGEPLHHKLQLCWPNSRSSASLPQNLFGQMFFFSYFLANQTCCRTSLPFDR